jgi:hypothetical protein
MINILLLCFIINILYINAMIIDFTHTSSTQYAQANSLIFGMASRGLIKIDYDIKPKDINNKYESYIVFLIINENERSGWYTSIIDYSLITDPSTVSNLCNLPSTYRKVILGGNEKGVVSYEIVGSASEYSVITLECFNGFSNNPITTTIKLSMENARPHSNAYSHVAIQEVIIVRIVQGECIVFGLLLIGLLGQIYFARQQTKKIHILFGVTLIVLLIHIISRYAKFYYINRDGYSSDSLDIWVNLLYGARTILTLLSLLMLSLGWGTVRPNLSFKEVKLITVYCVVYSCISLGDSCCLDASSMTCKSWELGSYILKSLLLLGIIVAMNFTVTQLRSVLMHTPWVTSLPLQVS